MSIPTVHRKGESAPTRAQKWRSTIILIEIVVLLAAVLLSTMQPVDSPPEVAPAVLPSSNTVDMVIDVERATRPSVEQRDTMRHPITVYVDSEYRVFILEDGRAEQHAQFRDCTYRHINVAFQGTLVNLHDTTILRHTAAVYSMTFDVTDYTVVSTPGDLTVRTADGAVVSITLDCDQFSNVTPMMVYVAGDTIFLADYDNQAPFALLEMGANCDLMWDTGNGQQRASLDEMAHPRRNGTWLPDDSAVAFRFNVRGDLTFSSTEVDGRPAIVLHHDGGDVTLFTDCGSEALDDLLSEAGQRSDGSCGHMGMGMGGH